MRLLKLGLASILILFLLVTAMGLLFPSEVRVSRAIDINAPVDSVYKLISDFTYWTQWVDGLKDQPGEFITANTSGKNAKALFGTNEIVFTTMDTGLIATTWRGSNGNEQEGDFRVIANKDQSITTVNWFFLEHLRWYPWERFASMMNDNILGPTMEKSLENLKQLAEKRINPIDQ